MLIDLTLCGTSNDETPSTIQGEASDECRRSVPSVTLASQDSQPQCAHAHVPGHYHSRQLWCGSRWPWFRSVSICWLLLSSMLMTCNCAQGLQQAKHNRGLRQHADGAVESMLGLAGMPGGHTRFVANWQEGQPSSRFLLQPSAEGPTGGTAAAHDISAHQEQGSSQATGRATSKEQGLDGLERPVQLQSWGQGQVHQEEVHNIRLVRTGTPRLVLEALAHPSTEHPLRLLRLPLTATPAPTTYPPFAHPSFSPSFPSLFPLFSLPAPPLLAPGDSARGGRDTLQLE